VGNIIVDLLLVVVSATVVPFCIVAVLFLLQSNGGLAKTLGFVAGGIAMRLVQGLLFGLVFGAAMGASSEGGQRLIVSTLLLVVGILLLITSLYASIEGSTDSELMFYLALTFGLEEDPPRAVERMVGFVEEVGRRHGTEHPIQMTVGTTDGNSVWGFRFSSEGDSRSLYYSTDVRALRELYPDRPRLREVSDEARIIVSEPLGDLPGVWNEVPESSYGVVKHREDELRPFRPWGREQRTCTLRSRRSGAATVTTSICWGRGPGQPPRE